MERISLYNTSSYHVCGYDTSFMERSGHVMRRMVDVDECYVCYVMMIFHEHVDMSCLGTVVIMSCDGHNNRLWCDVMMIVSCRVIFMWIWLFVGLNAYISCILYHVSYPMIATNGVVIASEKKVVCDGYDMTFPWHDTYDMMRCCINEDLKMYILFPIMSNHVPMI